MEEFKCQIDDKLNSFIQEINFTLELPSEVRFQFKIPNIEQIDLKKNFSVTKLVEQEREK